RNEAIGRQQLARRLLKGISYKAKPNGHHLWLSLPPQWNRVEFVAHVLRYGLAVVGDDAFAVGNVASPGVRVSLGAARNRAGLAQGLHFWVDPLNSSVAPGKMVKLSCPFATDPRTKDTPAGACSRLSLAAGGWAPLSHCHRGYPRQ